MNRIGEIQSDCKNHKWFQKGCNKARYERLGRVRERVLNERVSPWAIEQKTGTGTENGQAFELGSRSFDKPCTSFMNKLFFYVHKNKPSKLLFRIKLAFSNMLTILCKLIHTYRTKQELGPPFIELLWKQLVKRKCYLTVCATKTGEYPCNVISWNSPFKI